MQETARVRSIVESLRSAAAIIGSVPHDNIDGNGAAARVDTVRTGSLLIGELKAASRDAWLAAEERKEAVQRASALTDAHYLSLENVLYQRGHLTREIAALRAFETPEFSSISLPELPPQHAAANGDEHERVLAQLAEEAVQREALEARAAAARERLRIAQEVVSTKRAFLENLPKATTAAFAGLENLAASLEAQ